MHVRNATRRRPFQEGLEGLAGAVTPAGDRSDPTGAPLPSSPCTSTCERVPCTERVHLACLPEASIQETSQRGDSWSPLKLRRALGA